MRRAQRAKHLGLLHVGLFLAFHLALGLLIFLHLRVGLTNPAIVSMSFLLLILFVATTGPLWVAAVFSVTATLCLNFFFLPPVGTFTIADPQNWMALFTFLVVSIIASHLSSAARARALDAIARRDEVSRLYDLSRDILLTTESAAALPALARHIARRFEFSRLTLCLPEAGGWQFHEGAEQVNVLKPADLDQVIAGARDRIEFDAVRRSYGGQRAFDIDGDLVHAVPLRIGTRPIGVLAASGTAVDPGTLDAVAGLAAIAIERAHFLEERNAAEMERQRADLAAALLSSFSHDLRTPLTAIQVAVTNLLDATLPEPARREQGEIALEEVGRLNRLFQLILDMARIDAGITFEPGWVLPAEVVEEAASLVGRSLQQHPLKVEADSDRTVRVDPRLTSAALSHVLENAAQYSQPDSPIEVRAWVNEQGLHVSVVDHGPGLDPADLDHLFDRFYRGKAARRQTGIGVGLAIARGLLAAEGGRIWAENAPSAGARFNIVVPGPSRAVESVRDSPEPMGRGGPRHELKGTR